MQGRDTMFQPKRDADGRLVDVHASNNTINPNLNVTATVSPKIKFDGESASSQTNSGGHSKNKNKQICSIS